MDELLLSAFYRLTEYLGIANWRLDPEFRLLESDCPLAEQVLGLMLGDERREYLEGRIASGGEPVVLSIFPALSWILVFSRNGQDQGDIFIKGPFYNGYQVNRTPGSYLDSVPIAEDRRALEAYLSSLPMLLQNQTLNVAVMLHRAVRGVNIGIGDISLHASRMMHASVRLNGTVDQFSKRDGDHDLEQLILYKIRNGEPDIMDVFNQMVTSLPERHQNADPSSNRLEDARESMGILLTLVSRAAADAGVPRKSALSLCASYRRLLKQAVSISELSKIQSNYLTDYAQRVHRSRRFSKCSREIRLCIEYIDTHITQNVTLEQMAGKIGYSKHYLSRKFHQETGIPLVTYIHQRKVDSARYLLETTQKPLEEISEILGFGSRSYFTSVFKKITGESPSAYRETHSQL